MVKNYIIFSSIDWSTHWQIHHQLVGSIIDSGDRVLFIENTGARSPQIRDLSRIIDRLKSRAQSTYGYKNINDNLTVLTPIFIPYPYNKLSILLNTLIISKSIKNWIEAAKFYDPICIAFLPTPSVQEVIRSINPKLTIYYCADDMSRSLKNSLKLKKYEEIFYKNSDLVFTTSHKMHRRALQFSKSVYNIPAGIDSRKFPPKNELTIPSDIEQIVHPIIGYIGAISDVFNKNLIIKLANSLPNATIVLVGPKFTNITSLGGVDNILLLGERPHELMPNYINSFDVALIPYIVNETTDSVYSCKLNEYLSLGKIVLSTNLQEIRVFNEQNNYPVNIGVDDKDFIQKAKKLVNTLDKDTKESQAMRIKIAKKNTWDKRFSKISAVINDSLKWKLNNKRDWKGALIDRYSKSSYYFFNRVPLFLAFCFLIFYSPLFWFLGDQLVVNDPPNKSDAIVVFSGDGEVNYQNLSYQSRVLEAIKLYNKGYAEKIFLSSGREQTIADVEMIKLYLVNKGVPDTSIYMLDSYPNSTYQNVLMVKKNLEKNNIKSILFITAPYHSRRAVLTWKKADSNIRVLSYNSKNILNKSVDWGIGLDKIRVIVYEYAAILHNWINGRI